MTRLAEVTPFRGLRYNREKIGDLTQVVAPPYDIISTPAQARYHEKNPYNVIRLDYGLTLPEDDEDHNRYTRAATALAQWRREGVLTRDERPAFYFCREEYRDSEGDPVTRDGFIAAVRLADFSEGKILPHEETGSGAREDRFRLMAATRANSSAIYCLYADPENAVASAMAPALAEEPDVSLIDDAGTRHSLWVVDDPQITAMVTELMGAKQLLIADGHHRYETALKYRDTRRASGPTDAVQPYDYMMMYLSSMDSTAESILALHRLVSELDPDTVADLPAALEEHFDITPVTNDDRRGATMASLAEAGAHHRFGMYIAATGDFYLLESRQEKPALESDETGHSAAWRSLDVAVLDRLILKEIMGITPGGANADANVRYVEQRLDIMDEIATSSAQVAFFLSPVTMADIKAVAGEKMPRKSTFFHPKPLTGLVIRSMEEEA